MNFRLEHHNKILTILESLDFIIISDNLAAEFVTIPKIVPNYPEPDYT